MPLTRLEPPQSSSNLGALGFTRITRLPRWERSDEVERLGCTVTTLRSLGLPFASVLLAEKGHVAWFVGSAPDKRRDHALGALEGALFEPAKIDRLPCGQRGLLLSGLPGSTADSAALVRSGLSFALVTVAQPLPDPAPAWNELARELDIHVERGRTDLDSHQPRRELLQRSFARLVSESARGGLWAAATYLTSDSADPQELAALAMSALGGMRDDGPPMTIGCGDWIHAFVEGHLLPFGPAIDPSLSPLAPSVLVGDSDLATIAAPPSREAPGLARRRTADLDRVPVATGDITLGHTEDGHRVAIPAARLRGHAGYFGSTRSGKSNAVLGLLLDLHRLGIPFLVIEPAVKTEYRSLLRAIPELRVFTLGRDIAGSSAPFRMNPLEPPAGVPVMAHLDSVRAAMLAAFDLWEPLPQLLHQALEETYLARHIALDTIADPTMNWPRLGNLATASALVVDRAGHDAEVRDNLRAALTLRVESLRTPPKGTVLDCARSIDMEDLVSAPTVIEVHLDSPDEIALVMGMLVTRIASYRREQGVCAEDELRHLLVLEEAHRLLRDEQGERSDARAQIAESLATIGGLGQGILIADQAPSVLIHDVLRNTATKVLLGSFDEPDFEAVGRAMAATPEQLSIVPSLEPGDAFAFTRGEDAPLLVHTVDRRDDLIKDLPENTEIAARSASFYASRLDVLRPFPTCVACPSPCTMRSRSASIDVDASAMLAGVASGRAHEEIVQRLGHVADEGALAYCASAVALDAALGARAGDAELTLALAATVSGVLGLSDSDADDETLRLLLERSGRGHGPDAGCVCCPAPCTAAAEANAALNRSGARSDVVVLGRRPAPEDLLDLADEAIEASFGSNVTTPTLRFCTAHHLANAAGSTSVSLRTDLRKLVS